MSVRSTPRAGSSHLPRNASFSSEYSHDPSSSRRGTRADSLRLPPLAESSVVSSGLSTPETRRKRYLSKRKDSNLPNGGGVEVDWAEVEPDEVFRRLPVVEVKRVEQKMRTDALNKQSELRSMVGTRYRDLLTSATQITTLRSSSLRLSSSLKSIATASANPVDNAHHREDASDTTETADVMSVLPVAAHVKLLLDAPEALYSFLAHHEFLDAAYLWLVARVTKEGLLSMPDDISGPYSSLAEKQWESLVPFRAQIVQRATASLRSREKTDTKTLSETILALILLDNLTLNDALDLFLNQRSKAVRDILQHTETTHPSAGSSSRRRSSVISRDKEQIAKVLKDAIACLLDTVTLSLAVFDKRKKLESEPLIEEMVRLVQKAEAAPTSVALTPSTRRTSHERRASRLASISSPLPKMSFSTTASPVTAQKVLQTLPSSQILLRHLPTSITAFTPFITPSPAPPVSKRLVEWRSSSTRLVAEAAPSWLAALQSIQDVWTVRSALVAELQSGEFQQEIQEALSSEWAGRAKGIWSTKLDSIVNIARGKVEEGILALQTDPTVDESDVDAFAFSDLAYPLIPTTALATGGIPNMSLTPFMTSLKQRSSGRTPLLGAVLAALEGASSALRDDIEGLSGALLAEYHAGVKSALERLRGVLEESLAAAGSGGGDVQASLFVGRVALYIARSSSVLSDLAGEASGISDELVPSLLKLHDDSTSAWKTKSIRDALSKLDPLFHPDNTPTVIRLSWQAPLPSSPSTEIMLALQSLVGAVRQLGIPRGVETGVVREMVESFVDQAKGLDGWKDMREEGAVQASVDLGFLSLVKGETAEKAAAGVQTHNLPTSIPADFPTLLPGILADHLRRTQLLIYPLIAHLAEWSLPARTTASTTGRPAPSKNSNYLRFGAPPAGEFKSPVAVAKPGKRFGLLSIAV